MRAIYESLFVNPSIGALAPILTSLVLGTILSLFRKLAKIGAIILAIAFVCLVAYLLWSTGAVGAVLPEPTGRL